MRSATRIERADIILSLMKGELGVFHSISEWLVLFNRALSFNRSLASTKELGQVFRYLRAILTKQGRFRLIKKKGIAEEGRERISTVYYKLVREGTGNMEEEFEAPELYIGEEKLEIAEQTHKKDGTLELKYKGEKGTGVVYLYTDGNYDQFLYNTQGEEIGQDSGRISSK